MFLLRVELKTLGLQTPEGPAPTVSVAVLQAPSELLKLQEVK